jgi:tetratricopeptide (TPR) repeat protein
VSISAAVLGGVFAAIICAPGAQAQSPGWKALGDEAIALYRKADYERAERAASKALEAATVALGPDHPSVATSLANLATILEARRRYAQAQALFTRALAIREKALGTEHPLVARGNRPDSPLAAHADQAILPFLLARIHRGIRGLE